MGDLPGNGIMGAMEKKLSTIQKCAWGFAALFLFVYSLDYVPGVMDANGKMFGLFSMTMVVDIGHLALGALAIVGAVSSARWARIYFWFLGIVYGIDVVTYVISHMGTISPMTNSSPTSALSIPLPTRKKHPS